MIPGVHWAEKLLLKKNITSMTDSAKIEETEANPYAQIQLTSDIVHVKSGVQVLNSDTTNSDENFDGEEKRES